MDDEEWMFVSNESNARSTDDSVVGPINNELVVDYASEFTTYDYFESRDAMVDWVRNVAKGLVIMVVVKRSDSGGSGRGPRVLLSCERSGEHRNNKGKSYPGIDHNVAVQRDKVKGKEKGRSIGTKKCGCPFALRGNQISVGQWELEVLCGVHNHPCATYMVGHSYTGRLTSVEEALVVDMSKSNSRPKDILHVLKGRYPENTSTIKTIYNACQKHRVVEHAGRSQLQYIMGKLQEHGHFFHHRRSEESDTVTDLFFTHPTSVDLLRAFPRVLLMDCTYKTNRYKLPLLEIVGVTSTDMIFSVVCAYMEAECEDNYMWALFVLRSLFNQSPFPTMIVTDREIALMNAIERIFPTMRHMLYRWHISKNILAKCKKEFHKKDLWDSFILSWNVLVLAPDEVTLDDKLRRFHEDYSRQAAAVKYVMNSWISPYKERFVCCWTNQVMHFDNVTTNRATSAHAKLKRELRFSQGDLETYWVRMHALIETSHNAIKHSFEKSKIVVPYRFKPSAFKSLRGIVSITAMDKILEEMKGVDGVGVDPLLCGCVLRKTCGLPCAHEISECIRVAMPIPLDFVDGFWRKLDMKPCSGRVSSLGDDLGSHWCHTVDDVNNIFATANESEKLLMLRRLAEIANPATTSLLDPVLNAQSRGRPKKDKEKRSKSTKRNPSAFEYVQSIEDSCSPIDLFPAIEGRQKQKVVCRGTCKSPAIGFFDQISPPFCAWVTRTTYVESDGHCRLRVVVAFLGYGQDDWGSVRCEFMAELVSNMDLYALAFTEHNRAQIVLHQLNCFDKTAHFDHWMSMSENGYLIASTYNDAVVTLSGSMCCTYLPLRTCVSANPRCLCIGFVNKNHFIQVFLRDGHPLPHVANNWYKLRQACAASWRVFYNDQLALYDQIVGDSRLSSNINLA